MKYEKNIKKKCKKNCIKVWIGKFRIKTNCVFFSNACSNLKLMLCNQYIPLFESSDCSAWALKLTKNLKKDKFSIKIGPKSQ